MKYLFPIVCITCCAFQVNGQVTSARGWFEVDFNKGCEGLIVNTTITPSAPDLCYDPSSPLECESQWGDGTIDKQLTHTYSEDGTFTFIIIFRNDDGRDSVQVDINESIPPDFNLYACTNRRVAVNITDNGYDNYIVNDGTGGAGAETTVAQGAPDVILTYGDTSPKNISVRGMDNNAADNCPDNSQSITPLAALPGGNINTLEVISESELVLTYSLANNILYQLQVVVNGSTNYAPVKTLTPDITSDTISNLSLDDSYYCFRIATINSCDNSTDNLSTRVCSITPTLDIQDNLNSLSWISGNPEVEFDILRDYLTLPLVSVPPATRNFEDTDITCNTTYCYTLIGKYNNGVTSTSMEVCGTSFSTVPPDPIVNISSRVLSNTLSLTWEPPSSITSIEYTIYKKENENLILLGTTDSTTFETNLDPAALHCFEIHSKDECSNETLESITGCNLLLSGNIDKEDNISLVWNQYVGWENGIANYTIQKSYNAGGVTSINTNDTTFTEADKTANQVIIYTIVAFPNDNVENSISNTVRLIKPNNIYFPNAFTPDDDGMNDRFSINGRFITDFELKIFNRWGEMVFFTDNLDSEWDGTRNGRALPQGSYAFTAQFNDQAGREIEKDGTIVLIRK